MQSKDKEDAENSFPVAAPTPALLKQSQPVQVKPSAMKSTPATVKSEQELPTKQDFLDTLRRRMFDTILKRLGFVFEHTGRHDVYRHSLTSGIVVVPHSVEDIGTRISMWRQACDARPSEGKNWFQM